jgi:hypothetical protein
MVEGFDQTLTGRAIWQTQSVNVFFSRFPLSNRVLERKIAFAALRACPGALHLQCDSSMLPIEGKPGELVANLGFCPPSDKDLLGTRGVARRVCWQINSATT